MTSNIYSSILLQQIFNWFRCKPIQRWIHALGLHRREKTEFSNTNGCEHNVIRFTSHRSTLSAFGWRKHKSNYIPMHQWSHWYCFSGKHEKYTRQFNCFSDFIAFKYLLNKSPKLRLYFSMPNSRITPIQHKSMKTITFSALLLLSYQESIKINCNDKCN